MTPDRRKRISSSVAAIVALSLALAGTFAYATFATTAMPQGAPVSENKLAPLVEGGEISVDGPTQQKAGEEEGQLPLLVIKTEEDVQNGTTTWGGGNDQTYIAPKYVHKNYLEIKSKVDSIIIKSIKVDRGNCDAFSYGLPAAMRFGQAYTVLVGCDPLEAIVETDRGSFSFSWNQ